MSRRMIAGLLVIGMLAVPAAVRASSTGTLTLTVTVTPTLSVAVPRTTYDFGTLEAAVASVAAESTAVINDSTDSTEKYILKASNARGLVEWTLATSTGTDNYTLHAQFNATRPADFGNGDDDYNLTNDDQICDGIVFASAADQDGYNTAKGTEELLWFRIGAPSSVGSTDQKTIYITIIATNQG